ncbi:hypothetical protein GWI33_009231 [Rhynchophorus ferrugineus]|uniref:TELO2-interacting protein 1-like protein n=1 Tax=Rhynchophorus ferrugineus TaxID=354439 RepID=A0A834MGQ7_RHYFE|nr:hypothetical protein GWI33_009231 [Rhynchophorus ferrugineus]
MDYNSYVHQHEFYELFQEIKNDPADSTKLNELTRWIANIPKNDICFYEPILACFCLYTKCIINNDKSFSANHKILITETMQAFLKKFQIKSTKLFFNFYSAVIVQLYDFSKRQVLTLTEEYTLCLLETMSSLIQCVSEDIILQLYNKESVQQFSKLVFVCCELLKQKTSKAIKHEAIKNILLLGNISSNDYLDDPVLKSKISDIFMFYIPGISNCFSKLIMDKIHLGYSLTMDIINAYSRIIVLVMQDYNKGQKEIFSKNEFQTSSLKKKMWENEKEMNDYLSLTVKSSQWYSKTDINLNICFKRFSILIFHENPQVREMLISMARDITLNCYSTMPLSIATLMEFLILLSDDENPSISNQSRKLISHITEWSEKEENKLHFQDIFEYIKEGFYNAINSLPRKFNGVDDTEKISVLNLLASYANLFYSFKMQDVLQSPEILDKLMQSLLHISQLDTTNVQLLEVYTLKELNGEPDLRTPWIKFHNFKDERVKVKLEVLCKNLISNSYDNFQIIFDSLYNTILYNTDMQKEAIYLLNAFILGLDHPSRGFLKTILDMYTDEELNLQILLNSNKLTPEEIKNNVVKICLLTEGIGKTSLISKEAFKPYLLKCLYSVLEKAGHGNILISTAGLLSLHNIIYACGYKTITELINENFDYFSHQVRRRLVKYEDKSDVLGVLSVVFRYCSKDILLLISNVVEEVLAFQWSQDQSIESYLSVFKLFIISLRRWFNIGTADVPIKSKKQKELEYEHFKVSNIDAIENFSDDIMEGKTAEELYKEDMEKKKLEEKEENNEYPTEPEYKKPEPPVHIKLTTLILKRVLHFLPHKNRAIKLHALDILANGVEILNEWEDELLPIVHQIWSPLVQRFKEDSDPLIMRLSMNLLSVLAKLSKDFIRMRTVKEALPSIMNTLKKLAPESFLKDRRTAYRYSQNYKLQLIVLKSAGPVLALLDVDNKHIGDFMDIVFLYLSVKQPKELQMAAVEFIQTIADYDDEFVRKKIDNWTDVITKENEVNIKKIKLIEEIKGNDKP